MEKNSPKSDFDIVLIEIPPAGQEIGSTENVQNNGNEKEMGNIIFSELEQARRVRLEAEDLFKNKELIKAITLYDTVILKLMRTLGPEHEETLSSVFNFISFLYEKF